MKMTSKQSKTPFVRSILGTALLALTLPVCALAQQEDAEEQPEKAPLFGVSLNGGLTFSFTDVSNSKTAPVFGLGGHYFATPYLHVNIDVQKGWMKGGEAVSDGSNLMGFENNYFYGALTGRFFPVALLKNEQNNKAISLLSGIYGGTGVGFLSSSVKANDINLPEYGSLIEYSGVDFLIPIQVGFTIPVANLGGSKKLNINVDYRVNLCLTDKIDGYVPTVAANERRDAYNQLTAGVMLAF